LSSVTQQERESDKTIVYVAGCLSAIVLLLGALIIVLSILYLYKFRNRETSKS
jgi:ABC-type antimicrobial peptide transport system permease subunit